MSDGSKSKAPAVSIRDQTTDWRPSAPLSHLRKRAQLLAAIRQFFVERDVWEVDTPVLGATSVTDPNIASLSVRLRASRPSAVQCYLQTSPEYHMKRLLAAGSGSIYQMSKVFRDDEMGRLHNPEFTLLEWYRIGFDHHALMAEVAQLLTCVGIEEPVDKISYRALFERYLGLNPHKATSSALRACAQRHGLCLSTQAAAELDRDGWLDLLLTHCIEPRLGEIDGPVFVYDYPASQAALAKITEDDEPVAQRFEVYVNGIELANGYRELTDKCEQKQRFVADNLKRGERGLPVMASDERLLAALDGGLPACAGVALGVDRLLLCLLNARVLDDAMAFPLGRA